jgi:hypothetical protein
VIRITASIIITTQIKIPTPIPALKIPPTTLHELIISERNNKENTLTNLEVFMASKICIEKHSIRSIVRSLMGTGPFKVNGY